MTDSRLDFILDFLAPQRPVLGKYRSFLVWINAEGFLVFWVCGETNHGEKVLVVGLGLAILELDSTDTREEGIAYLFVRFNSSDQTPGKCVGPAWQTV